MIAAQLVKTSITKKNSAFDEKTTLTQMRGWGMVDGV